LFDDAFDDIKRDTMSEEPRRARAGFRRKTWRSTLLVNRLPQETARKCKNYINLQRFCYGFPTKATKTNELDTFKDIN